MAVVHVVSHTHWDREWYRTFQEFRFRLVRLIDELVDLLESEPDYRFFTLDGQTIILDDYLSIRPEQEPRIRGLVQSGRLLVGPWYVLPDEFLEGPEALIRNLVFGQRGCRRFTADRQPMEGIGYLPDPFGHISQLPQIAAGCGLEALCLWRGVGDAPTEFRWMAPDGTERLVLHLRDSYSNGAWLARGRANCTQRLSAARDSLLPYATTKHVLIMQGTDHLEPCPELPSRLRACGEQMGESLVHSTLPAYLAAVQAELGDQGLCRLPVVQGELRSPERAHLLPGVLSARMWIKQRNAECERLLTDWAEPLSALAEALLGTRPHRGFLRESWSCLLRNHPHDSICGCSVDQVHREMISRFDAAAQLAELVAQAGLEALAQALPTKGAAALAEIAAREPVQAIPPPFVVFNPTTARRTDRVRLRLPPVSLDGWTPVDARGRQVPWRLVALRRREHRNEVMDRSSFARLVTDIAEGKGPHAGQFAIRRVATCVQDQTGYVELEVGASADAPSLELGAEQLVAIQHWLGDDSVQAFHVHITEWTDQEIELLAQDVPGWGYAQYSWAQGAQVGSSPGRSEAAASGTDRLAIENEFLAVEVDPADGTLTITHKASGTVLAGCNRFVDEGDRGDEYTFCRPQHDTVVRAPAAPPIIRRIEDGIGQTLEVNLAYRVPRGLVDGDRASRSSECVELPISTRATLTPGIARVEFETTISNTARDHRLRVHFPTPICTDRSWAEGHFDVVERPIALPVGTELWAEQPVGTQPQLTFVDVTDGCTGVMLANRGLPEYEVLPGTASEPGVTLVLTLLRCVGWLSRGDLATRSGHAGPALETPEAQCLGEYAFHYALIPHVGGYLSAQHEAHAFNAPLRAVATDVHDGTLPEREGSLLELWPRAVVLSCVKPPEEGEGMVARIYNSAPVSVQARLRLWRSFHDAMRVTLDEREVIGSLASKTDRLTLPMRPKEIATLRICFA